jgi:hypothetical protein
MRRATWRNKRWIAGLVVGLCYLIFLGDVVYAANRAVPSVADVETLLKSGETTVRVVCFGDSITGVYYHSGSQRAWCDMLSSACKKSIRRRRSK